MPQEATAMSLRGLEDMTTARAAYPRIQPTNASEHHNRLIAVKSVPTVQSGDALRADLHRHV